MLTTKYKKQTNKGVFVEIGCGSQHYMFHSYQGFRQDKC